LFGRARSFNLFFILYSHFSCIALKFSISCLEFLIPKMTDDIWGMFMTDLIAYCARVKLLLSASFLKRLTCFSAF